MPRVEVTSSFEPLAVTSPPRHHPTAVDKGLASGYLPLRIPPNPREHFEFVADELLLLQQWTTSAADRTNGPAE